MEEDILFLKLRDAIADKEWITAAAQHDTAKYGEWQSNWADSIKKTDKIISILLSLLEPV